jgi:hypothetical protein
VATNKDLIAEAGDLSRLLGIEAPTDGLNNSALTALVESLQAQLNAKTGPEDAPAPPPDPNEPPAAPPVVNGADDGSQGGAPEAPAPVVALPKGYSVKAGMSITSLRGVLDERTVVHARDFTHGQTTIDELVERGAIVKG